MSWLPVLPGLLGLAALWVLPGYAVLRALGIRGLLAWGGAGGVTSGLAGVLAILYDRVGLGWGLATFLAGCVVVTAVAAGIGAWLRTWRDPGSLLNATGGRLMTRSERGWLSATYALGALVLGLTMMVGISRPDMPLQAWDGVFHLNAVWFIQETGNASSLGGLAPMYADTIAPYYPTVWHSIVAIAPFFPGVSEAANASSIVIGTALWLTGLLALSRVVWPARVLPVVLTPVVAATYVTFPAVAVSMLGVWPFAVSTACLPGLLALLIAALRGGQSWRLHLSHLLGTAACAVGVVMAHGSGLFSFVLLAGPLAAVLLFRQGRRFWLRGHRVFVATAGTLLVVGLVALTVFLLNFPPVQAIVDYERGGSDSYLPGLASILIDHPLIYVYPFLSFNLVVTVLVGIGVWLTIRRRHARWLVVALAAALALTLLAGGPVDNPLRVLAGFWYTQPSRLNQLLDIPAIVLGAGGAAWVARKAAARWSWPLVRATAAVVVGIGVLTFGFRWPTHVVVMSSVYSTWPIAWGTMLEPEEIDMVDRADETLPDDAVVLGEPVNGSPFLLSRSGVEVVYPQLTTISDSPERVVLAERFDQWWRDPEVCEAVRALGVTHVYTDELTFEEGAKWEESTPGLREARPTRDAFELVDRGGKAAIWRFTGCDG
jgi:hypothetical protein